MPSIARRAGTRRGHCVPRQAVSGALRVRRDSARRAVPRQVAHAQAIAPCSLAATGCRAVTPGHAALPGRWGTAHAQAAAPRSLAATGCRAVAPGHAAGGRGGSSARGVEERGAGGTYLYGDNSSRLGGCVEVGEKRVGGAGWRLHEASSDAGEDGALGSAAAAKGVAAGQERRFLLGGMTRGARTQAAAAAGHARALGFGEGAPALGGPRGRAREWAGGWLGRG
eukprot:XP_008671550.1 spidroin-1-like [Zea mays]